MPLRFVVHSQSQVATGCAGGVGLISHTLSSALSHLIEGSARRLAASSIAGELGLSQPRVRHRSVAHPAGLFCSYRVPAARSRSRRSSAASAQRRDRGHGGGDRWATTAGLRTESAASSIKGFAGCCPPSREAVRAQCTSVVLLRGLKMRLQPRSRKFESLKCQVRIFATV
jgi:hypothetical protein